MKVIGYKVFNPDWTCRGKQYTCPGKFEENVELSVCNSGMHFCKRLNDCFNYYFFNSDNKVALVTAYGKIQENDGKYCTDKLEIIKELSWHEVLNLVNTGKNNTGRGNTGNRNTGNYNTGNRNTGNYNTGNYNTGYCNTGDYNTGDYNAGYRNTGYCNTGDYNTGWFCTETPKLILFDRETDMTREEFMRTEAYTLLRNVSFTPTKWVFDSDMTEEEKSKHPEYKTQGGYLKLTEANLHKAFYEWWNRLDDREKDVIKAMPNFDADKFKTITGIDVDLEEDEK